MGAGKTQGYYELRRDEKSTVSAWRIQNNVFMPHFHSALEVLFVEEGEIIVYQDGIAHLIGQGKMAVNSSYMVHSCITPNASRVIVATVPLTAIPQLKGLLLQRRFKESIIDTRGMKECGRILRMMSEAGNQGNERFVNCLAEALLAYLIEKIGLVEDTFEDEEDLVKRILGYMENNAHLDLTVATAAAHFGYSPGRFSHIFNERIGCSFTRYVNFLRCRIAQGLLETTRSPLIEVAGKSGFASLRTFHRVYREFTGHAPRQSAEQHV